MDAASDGSDRAEPQRDQDVRTERTHGALRFSRLHLWAWTESQGRPLVSGRKAVEEVGTAAEGEGADAASTEQQGSAARGRSGTQPPVGRLGQLLQLRKHLLRLPVGGRARLRTDAQLPPATPQGVHA